jgi:signal transduction histidine kinase
LSASETSPQSPQVKTAENISLATIALLTAGVFVVSLVSIAFTRAAFIATFWPSKAIVLAVLLRGRRNSIDCALVFGGGFAALFLANLAGGTAPVLSAQFAAANLAEIAAATAILIRLNTTTNVAQLRPLSVFIIVAGGIAPLLGASLGAAAVGHAHSLALTQVWFHWYASDALGMIIVGPFMLILSSEHWRSLRLDKRYTEACGMLLLVLLAVVVVAYYRGFLFAVVPVVLVAIFRFGVVGAAVATLAVALVGTIFIINGIGSPIITQSLPSERIFALQIFLATMALWSLPVSAVLAERDSLLSALAAANSGLQAENAHKSQMLVGVRRELVNMEERERLRLSHELHDQTGQTLVAALMELGQVEAGVGEVQRARLQRLRRQVEEIAGTIHHISTELRPAAIDGLGLANALANHACEWGAQFGVEVDFHCGDSMLDDLPDDTRITVYRIVGEALANVSKHAEGATTVSIVISRERSRLQIAVEDNGCGFDTALPDRGTGRFPGAGLGLSGMRERLLLLGGELEIESSAGLGTTIFARLPV